MNGVFRSLRRRVVTEKFTTRRVLRTRNARWQRTTQVKRAGQDS